MKIASRGFFPFCVVGRRSSSDDSMEAFLTTENNKVFLCCFTRVHSLPAHLLPAQHWLCCLFACDDCRFLHSHTRPLSASNEQTNFGWRCARFRLIIALCYSPVRIAPPRPIKNNFNGKPSCSIIVYFILRSRQLSSACADTVQNYCDSDVDF